MTLGLQDRIIRSVYDSMEYPTWVNIEISSTKSLNLRVWKNVFDPRFGYTTKYMLKTLAKSDYKWKHSVDLGTGTGILAMALRALNISERVDALEKNELAVENALWNTSGYNKKNQHIAKALRSIKIVEKVDDAWWNISDHNKEIKHIDGIRVFHADLFFPIGDFIPQATYDGGVFNHTYLPDSDAQEVWQPKGEEGGYTLIKRGLEESKKNFAPGAPLIMPYTQMVDDLHNPKIIAESLGMRVTEIDKYTDDKKNHFIYEIIPVE